MKKFSPQEMIEILKQRKWSYAGQGYWLDPVTKTKYLVNSAFEVEFKREQPSKNINTLNLAHS